MANFIVSGAGYSAVDGTYTESGTYNGKPSYTKSGGYILMWDDGSYGLANSWAIIFLTFGQKHYYSAVDTPTPASSGWTTFSAFGATDPPPNVAEEGGSSSSSSRIVKLFKFFKQFVLFEF